MKTALIVIKNGKNTKYGQYVQNFTQTYQQKGVQVNSVSLIDANDDIGLNHAFSYFSSRFDNLVIVGGEVSFNETMRLVLERFESSLVENDNAKNFVCEYAQATSQPVVEKYFNLPLNATVIPNKKGYFQGYLIEDDFLTLSVLPSPADRELSYGENYLLSYLENKYELISQTATIKYFGDSFALFSSIENTKNHYSYSVNATCQYGDWKVDFVFNSENEKREVLRTLAIDLGDDIYAQMDTSLSQRLFDLLRLKNLKLATAESFTAGKIASSVIDNPGASSFFHEGIVAYSNTSKIERLGVKDVDIKSQGAVSSIVAYQMCAGLLMKGDIDIAISTTGIAGPKSDDSNKPVGLCYIGIGMKDGIHTYKYNFKGNREEISQTAINTALFLAINKLKRT